MKKKLFLLFIFIPFLAGCVKDGVEDFYYVQTDSEVLYRNGYDTLGMFALDDYYFLRPDLLMPKERVDELRSKGLSRMQIDEEKGTLDDKHRVIYVATMFSSHPYELREAIKAWNSIPESGLKFIVKDEQTTGVVIVRDDMFPVGNDELMAIDRPHNGDYGTSMVFNMNSSLYPQYNRNIDQLKYMYMHGLGHLVGFEHALTEWQADMGDWYSGTAFVDAASIMVDENGLKHNPRLWRGFSLFDEEAVRVIYPVPATETVEKIVCTEEGEENVSDTLKVKTAYIFTALYGKWNCPDPRYKFEIMPMDGQTSDSYRVTDKGNGKIEVMFNTLGKFRITATVLNDSEKVVISKDYTVKRRYLPKYGFYCTPESYGSDMNYYKKDVPYTFYAFYEDELCPSPVFSVTVLEDMPYEPEYVLEHVSNGVTTITFTGYGPFNIIFQVTNAPERVRFDEYAFVNDENVILKGPKQVELGKTYSFEIYTEGFSCLRYDLWQSNSLKYAGDVTVAALTDGRSFNDTFNEPGRILLVAGQIGNPTSPQDSWGAHIYYRPYYKIEQTVMKYRVSGSLYRNRLRFFYDAGHTLPIPYTEHVLHYELALLNVPQTALKDTPHWDLDKYELVSEEDVYLPAGQTIVELPYTCGFYDFKIQESIEIIPTYSVRYYPDKYDEDNNCY